MHMTTKTAMENPAIKEAIEKANARKMPKAVPELDGASEKEVVSEIVTALRLQGYRTPKEWKPGTRGIYIRIGQRKAKGSGTDEGCPDLIIVKFTNLHDEHYDVRRLIEVKARTTSARLSKEQNTLERLGVIYVVNSASQTLALLENA